MRVIFREAFKKLAKSKVTQLKVLLGKDDEKFKQPKVYKDSEKKQRSSCLVQLSDRHDLRGPRYPQGCFSPQELKTFLMRVQESEPR